MDTILCKLCNNPHGNQGTKLCDPCWELKHRIIQDPNIAKLILLQLEQSGQDQPERAHGFLKAFARYRLYEIRNNGVLAYRVRKSKQTVLDAGTLEEAIFNNFLGMKVQEIYYVMIDKKVSLTRGGDLWHQDDTFQSVIENLIAEESCEFQDFFNEINS